MWISRIKCIFVTGSSTTPVKNSLVTQSENSQICLVSNPSDDISMHVLPTIKQKILTGEYVDLAVLLNHNSITHPQSQKIVLINGELVLQSKQDKKILSVDSWTDAFIVFMSIYCSLHTNLYPHLLKYMNIIRSASKLCSTLGWKSYDEQFRQRKSIDPTSPWDQIDHELWLLYISNGQTHSNQFLPRQYRNIPNTPLKCYTFNYTGRCVKSPCVYRHECLKCSEPHPSIYCKINQPFQTTPRPRLSSPNSKNSSMNNPRTNYHFDLRHQRPRNPTQFVGFRENTN